MLQPHLPLLIGILVGFQSLLFITSMLPKPRRWERGWAGWGTLSLTGGHASWGPDSPVTPVLKDMPET